MLVLFLANTARSCLLHSPISGCHATLTGKEPFGGALRDIPKDGCEGDYEDFARWLLRPPRHPLALSNNYKNDEYNDR